MKSAINYGMFTDEGNKLVHNMVTDAIKKSPNSTNPQLYEYLSERMDRIEDKGHAEVHDTSVRESVIFTIEQATSRKLSIYSI